LNKKELLSNDKQKINKMKINGPKTKRDNNKRILNKIKIHIFRHRAAVRDASIAQS